MLNLSIRPSTFIVFRVIFDDFWEKKSRVKQTGTSFDRCSRVFLCAKHLTIQLVNGSVNDTIWDKLCFAFNQSDASIYGSIPEQYYERKITWTVHQKAVNYQIRLHSDSVFSFFFFENF